MKPEECLHCALWQRIEQFNGGPIEGDTVLDAIGHTAELLADLISNVTPKTARRKLVRQHAKLLGERVTDKASRKSWNQQRPAEERSDTASPNGTEAE